MELTKFVLKMLDNLQNYSAKVQIQSNSVADILRVSSAADDVAIKACRERKKRVTSLTFTGKENKSLLPTGKSTLRLECIFRTEATTITNQISAQIGRRGETTIRKSRLKLCGSIKLMEDLLSF